MMNKNQNTHPKKNIKKSSQKTNLHLKQATSIKEQKRLKNLIMRHRIMIISRAVFFISFATLIFIGISHLVRAVNLTQVPSDNGVPSSWGIVSASHPDSITLPITYFDQNYDCAMFEFSHCNNVRDKSGGWTPNIVKDTLGMDGLPIPSNATANNSLTPTSKHITGNDPVEPSDNFYQWFHEVDGKSTKYDREITFQRVGNENKYTYGGRQIFPLDGVKSAQKLEGHNFHFTAHMQVPIKTNLSGTEIFDFSGDDDVWVFLNGHLVLDIGGVHTVIDGNFTINTDGTVSSRVFEGGKTYSKNTYDLGLKKGQVVNLDFFYAERNTSEANTLITITDMEWPISADSEVSSEVINNKLVEYTASIQNRDPSSAITLEKVAAHLVENDAKSGFLPLDKKTLSYSNNPTNEGSWKELDVSAPAGDTDGFQLAKPVTLAPSGQPGDTTYVRFFVSPEANEANYRTTVSFYTTNKSGDSGISYDTAYDTLEGLEVIAPEYTVTYDSDGGTPVPAETVTKNQTATRPADPDKTKHIFLGWYLDGESYNFDAPVTKNITLVAHWETIPDQKFVVAFDSDGGTPVESQTVIEHEKAVQPDSPTKDGYEFTGWNLENHEYDFNSEVTASITLVAQWRRVDFLVVFDSDGGSVVAPQTIHEGNAALVPTDPTRDDYDFAGWQLDGQPYDFATPVTKDILLTATWTPIVTPEPEPEPTPEPEPEEPEPTPTPEPSVESTDTEPTTPQPATVSPLGEATETAIAERLIIDQTTDEDPMVAFLPVLGAVSYVPNTGLITQLNASPFANQTIASVVLSQPFAIVTLGLFSASFAIYYPNRRY